VNGRRAAASVLKRYAISPYCTVPSGSCSCAAIYCFDFVQLELQQYLQRRMAHVFINCFQKDVMTQAKRTGFDIAATNTEIDGATAPVPTLYAVPGGAANGDEDYQDEDEEDDVDLDDDDLDTEEVAEVDEADIDDLDEDDLDEDDFIDEDDEDEDDEVL